MLKGKTAIVTGSTSGIGLGIAEGLRRGRHQPGPQRFGDAAEIEKIRAGLASKYGVKVTYDGADMSKSRPDRGHVRRRPSQTIGAVDILVNNAGIQHVCPIEEFPIEKWDQIIAINLSAAFHTTRLVLPYMKSQGLGPHRERRLRPRARRLAVQARLRLRQARHPGLHQDGRAGSRREGHHRQRHLPRLRADAAGGKADPRHRQGARHHRRQVKRDVLLAAQPTKQFVTAEQVAGTAVFLCSDAAASITGTHIAVEGGWTAH